MTKPLLIGLTGLAGAGKDTVRDMLVEHHNFDGIAFADPIRDMLRALFDTIGVDESWMVDRNLKEAAIPQIGSSYRHMAQALGTEWGRAINPDFWLKIAGAKVSIYGEYGGAGVVVSDVRFANEAEWIKQQGGVIWKILRPGLEPVRAHVSEQLADVLPYDYVIDNHSDIDNLRHAVACAVLQFVGPTTETSV